MDWHSGVGLADWHCIGLVLYFLICVRLMDWSRIVGLAWIGVLVIDSRIGLGLAMNCRIIDLFGSALV